MIYAPVELTAEQRHELGGHLAARQHAVELGLLHPTLADEAMLLWRQCNVELAAFWRRVTA